MGWAQPIFFCFAGCAGRRIRMRDTVAANLGELLQRTLPAMGYELVELESTGRGGLVRVFIDKPEGVDVDDCARVSNHLTRLFAVENIDFDRLEVSSPGLDRPLTKLADYARFAGCEAQLTLTAPIGGAKRMKGIVRGVDGDNVNVETAKGMQTLPFASIGRARLVPRIDWRKA
jgi:ribosome maturation factor RimP